MGRSGSGLGPPAAPPVLPDPESVSGQRRGPLWCSGAAPAPAARAAPRLEGQAAKHTFQLQLGDLLQGNRRCSCPGWERGAGVPEGEAGADPRQLPPRPSPRPDAGPHAHASGIPHCSGRGWALGVPGAPTPNHQRRAGSHSRGPPSLPRGRAGQRRPHSDTTGTAEETCGRSRAGSPSVTLSPLQGLPRYLLPSAGERVGRPGPRAPHKQKSGAGVRAHPGLSAPGGGNRKDATVWGFTIQNGKNARKLYSIFPVKVITLPRTKRKRSRREVGAGPASCRAAGSAPRVRGLH